MSEHAQERSGDLHELGTELSRRLREAQQRIAALPKRCDHRVLTSNIEGCVPEEEIGLHAVGVGFRREGKEWCLFYVISGRRIEVDHVIQQWQGSGPESQFEASYEDWIELSSCSLTQKSIAASLLPDLIREMQEEYDRRRLAVGKALNILDRLDGVLPPLPAPEKGGQ